MDISTSFPFVDKDGLAFQIKYLRTPLGITSRESTYQGNQRFKQRRRSKSTDRNVRSTNKYLIPPYTSVAIPVVLKFTSELNYTHVKKVFSSSRDPNYGCTPLDSLFSKQHPQHHDDKFFATMITIQVEQVLRTAHRFGRMEKYLTENMELIFVLASLTWGLVEVRNPPLWLGVDSGPLSEPPAKEGLKANEVSGAASKNSQSLEGFDICPELPPH